VLKDEKLKERKRERGKDDQKDLEERSKVEGWMIKELGWKVEGLKVGSFEVGTKVWSGEVGTSISKSKVKGLLKVWRKLMIKELRWDQLDSKLGHLPLVWRFDQVRLGRRSQRWWSDESWWSKGWDERLKTQSWVIWGWYEGLIRWSWDVDLKGQRLLKVWWKLMIKELGWKVEDSKLGHLRLVQKFDQVKLGRRSQRSKVVEGLTKVDDQRVEMRSVGLKVGSFEVGTKVWSGEVGMSISKVVDDDLMKVDDQRVGMRSVGLKVGSLAFGMKVWSGEVGTSISNSKVWWKLMIKGLGWKVEGLKVGSLAFGMKVWSGALGRRPRAGALGSKWGHLRMGRRLHRVLGGGTRKWEKETLEKSVES
jgi:hypothetical protein